MKWTSSRAAVPQVVACCHSRLKKNMTLVPATILALVLALALVLVLVLVLKQVRQVPRPPPHMMQAGCRPPIAAERAAICCANA